MGEHKWACPNCGQGQKEEVPNGQEVPVKLCAACKEKHASEEAEVLSGAGNKAAKEKALDALDAKYKVPRQKAESAEAV